MCFLRQLVHRRSTLLDGAFLVLQYSQSHGASASCLREDLAFLPGLAAAAAGLNGVMEDECDAADLGAEEEEEDEDVLAELFPWLECAVDFSYRARNSSIVMEKAIYKLFIQVIKVFFEFSNSRAI